MSSQSFHDFYDVGLKYNALSLLLKREAQDLLLKERVVETIGKAPNTPYILPLYTGKDGFISFLVVLKA